MTTQKAYHARHAFGLFSETLSFAQNDTLLVTGNSPVSIKGIADARGTITGVGKLEVNREDRRLHVRVNGPMEVKTPADVPLQVRITGPVKIKGISRAAIEVEAVTGPLEVSNSASVHVHSATGPLTVSKMSGDVAVDAVTGPSFFKRVDGALSLSRAKGPVTVDKCGGDVAVSGDDVVFIHLTGDHAQVVKVRSDDNVYLVLPATARIQGSIQAEGEITVDLAQNPIHQEDASISLTPSAGDAPIISVDIRADGDVYLGPNPPVSMPKATSVKQRTWGRSLSLIHI